MKIGLRTARIAAFRAILAGAALALSPVCAQAQAPANPPPDQSQPQQPAKPQPAPKAPSESNPFPEDTNTVPLLPSSNPPPAAAPSAVPDAVPALPPSDVDPVRSPDQAPPYASSSSASGDSSSSSDLAAILAPPPDEETHKSKKAKDLGEPEHTETAKEDESVADYYLGQKNWRAALSRYQSALILDPENPDVYWGLAESQRHLGDLPSAKSNYKKVMEYDPDSKHAKEAKKLLNEPEMANAPPPPPSR